MVAIKWSDQCLDQDLFFKLLQQTYNYNINELINMEQIWNK
ncbi:hypothetical protein pb186bvf_016616 [Paramecium bursaria]